MFPWCLDWCCNLEVSFPSSFASSDSAPLKKCTWTEHTSPRFSETVGGALLQKWCDPNSSRGKALITSSDLPHPPSDGRALCLSAWEAWPPDPGPPLCRTFPDPSRVCPSHSALAGGRCYPCSLTRLKGLEGREWSQVSLNLQSLTHTRKSTNIYLDWVGQNVRSIFFIRHYEKPKQIFWPSQ